MLLPVIGKHEVLVFDVNDIRQIRDDYGILGTLIGTLLQYPQQNVFLLVPLKLMVWETMYLVEHGAILVDYLKYRGSLRQTRLNRICVGKSTEENFVITRDWIGERDQDEREKGEVKVIENEADGKDEEEDTQSEDAKPEHTQPEHTRSEHTQSEHTQPEDAPKDTQNEDNSTTFEDNSSNDTPLDSSNDTPLDSSNDTPVDSSINSPTIPPDCIISLDSYLEAYIAHTKNNDVHRQYRIFRKLRDAGYFVLPGLKFGGDLVIYPGDPLKFHSYAIVKFDEASANDILVGGRLATSVKKSFVVVGEDNGKSEFYQIQWAGFG